MEQEQQSPAGKPAGKNRGKKSSANSINTMDMVYGKVPPQSKDLEEAVLGAIMLEPPAFDIAAGILSVPCFYVEAHQHVFAAMNTLYVKNQPMDILMVIEQLKTDGRLEAVGGPYAVTKLTNSVTSSANIASHSRKIFERFLQREMIRIGGQIVSRAFEDNEDVFDLLSESEQMLLSIGNLHLHGELIGIDNVLMKTLEQIGKYRANQHPITGVPSGFRMLDRATRGWQPGDVIIVAARPSVGKSAFALKLAKAATRNEIRKVPTAFFSLEMSAVQLVLRMLAEESEILLHALQTGRLDDAQMQVLYKNGVQQLAENKIFFDDAGSLNLFQLRSKCRRLKKKHPDLGLIIIDYLQLMTGDAKGNREQEISSISRGLKQLAKELNVPIIALSQLSRAVDKGGNPREPQISDLRESGAIEQDADLILLLWGPTEEAIRQDKTLENRRYAKVGKARNGMLMRMDLEFRTEIQRIEEWEGQVNGPAAGPGFKQQSNLFDSKSQTDLPI
jgi:replicative DNA helicase